MVEAPCAARHRRDFGIEGREGAGHLGVALVFDGFAVASRGRSRTPVVASGHKGRPVGLQLGEDRHQAPALR